MPYRKLSNTNLYHVYSRGNNKTKIFNGQKDILKLLHIINDTYIKYDFLIHAYSFMDNHYHLLLEDTQQQISNIMHLINLRYAKYFNYQNHRTGKLFEREFQSKPIITERYFMTLVKYIHNNWSEAGNPLNKYDPNLCSYSSYQKDYSKLNNLTTDKFMTLLAGEDFENYHQLKELDFNPLIRNAEKAYLLKDKIFSLDLSQKEKQNLLVYSLKNHNENSSQEIMELSELATLGTARYKIKSTLKAANTFESQFIAEELGILF